MAEDFTVFLDSTAVIDWQHPAVLARAQQLAEGISDVAGVVEACFVWVRDEISHSHDIGASQVTCSASAVLQYGTGICYAKSHLLAALLRANGIPAGFCYQRLSRDEDRTQYCLHGLNAVHLPDIGWYRIDARGNKPGVDARFTPPVEQLAFPISYPGEVDIPGIWAEPLPVIVDLLSKRSSLNEIWDRLPDLPVVPSSVEVCLPR